MKIPGPILYLYEYRHIPEEIRQIKNDEDLIPWESVGRMDFEKKKKLPERLCVGIGTYRTREDGELYLCALIDPATRQAVSWAIGVYRSAELVDRALERLFSIYDAKGKTEASLILRSSRNPLYQTRLYREILAKYFVRGEWTEKGTRGGVMAVSAFFSQLMRKKGGYEFQNWQDGVDWLSRHVCGGIENDR